MPLFQRYGFTVKNFASHFFQSNQSFASVRIEQAIKQSVLIKILKKLNNLNQLFIKLSLTIFSLCFLKNQLLKFQIFVSQIKDIFNIKTQYKYLNFLFIFYIIFGIFTPFIAYESLSNKFNLYFSGLVIALISFTFVFEDIIAEIYGIKVSAIFYSSMITIRIIVALLFCILYNGLTITKYLLFAAFYHPLIFTFSWYINVYLLTKWKILTQGKRFWLRSIGSSGFLISLFCIFSIKEDRIFVHWSNAEFITDTILSYLFRVLFLIMFAFPGNFIVNILKIVENNHQKPYFNPFKI